MSGITIGEGTQVTLHFALKLEGGEVVDSNFDGEPATFVVGDGSLLDGFQQALFGLGVGAQETFVIPPAKAFGQHNSNNIQDFPLDQFEADVKLEKGLVLTFADAKNAELPGIVTQLSEASVTVDFNHPLAGRDIIFEVAILSVEPVVTH